MRIDRWLASEFGSTISRLVTCCELFGSQLFFSPESRMPSSRARSNWFWAPIDRWKAIRIWRPLSSSGCGGTRYSQPHGQGWDGAAALDQFDFHAQRANFAAELVTGNRRAIADPERSVSQLASDNPEVCVRYYGNLLLNRELEPDVVARLAGFMSRAQEIATSEFRGVIQLIKTMPEFQLV